MKTVLLLVAPTTTSPLATARAIEQAAALNADLLAVAVLDPAVSGRLARTLEDSGFVGEKVCESVRTCLDRDLRTQCEELLAGIAAQAAGASVRIETRIDEGDLSEAAAHCCEGREIVVAVVAAEKRSWLGRLLASDTDVRRRLRLPRCEVEVIEG